MTWNHRVVKETLDDGMEWLTIREVFYNENGEITGYTEDAVNISGETVEDLRWQCQKILECLDKDVLIDGKVVFASTDKQP
jgi:hypothetical protein